MAINGTFKTTRFAELLRYYATSKDSATIRIQFSGGNGEPDGIFRFVHGELVEGSLQGARGREALRRALELRDGSFAEELDDQEILESAFRTLPEEEAGAARPVPSWTPVIGSARPSVAPPTASTTASPIIEAAPAIGPAKAPTLDAAPVGPSAPVTAAASDGAMAADPVTPPQALEAGPTESGPPVVIGERRRRTGVVLALGTLVALGLIAASLFFPKRAPTAPSATGTPTAAPGSASSAARGVLPDTVILGMVSSFSGSNKERGRSMRIGWEIAIAEANDAGGVHGRKVRLVVQDDGYDPSRTLAGMKAVVEEGAAFAIVGNVGTATAAVAIPYAGEKDAVFFGALSGGDLLRKTPPDRHVFNFRASLAREAEAAVRYLVQVRRLKPQRIAVLAQDDEFGASGRRGALGALDAYGVGAGEVLQLSYPRNTADVNDALAKLRARKDVEAVVMVATYKPAATFVRKVKDAGLDPFFTTVSADSTGLAEELAESGPEYTRGVLLTQVVPVPTSHATALVHYRQVLEKYAPGEKPSSTSLEAWIGAQVFLEGMRRAGRDLDTAKLIAALEGIRDLDIGIGGDITFGPADHQGCDVVWGWLLQPDGSYRQIDLD